MSSIQKLSRAGEAHSAMIFVAYAVAANLTGALMLLQAAQEGSESVYTASGLYDTPKTAAYCVAGAVLGAFLSLVIFPGKSETNSGAIRQLAAKFGSSMAVALVFGPGAMEYFGVVSLNMVAAWSGAIALFGIAILHNIAPTVVPWFTQWFKGKLSKDDS